MHFHLFRYTIIYLLLLVITGCRHSYIQTSEKSFNNNAPVAIRYYNAAFEEIRRQSIHSSDINWEQLYNGGLSKIQNATTVSDTYDAIRYVIKNLNDNHSFFRAPAVNGRSAIVSMSDKAGSFPFSIRALNGDICMIELRSYNSLDLADQHTIADSLYNAVYVAGTRKMKGLILDLRKMEGGSAPPFLAAFAPLIDQQFLLGYVDNKRHKTQITRYQNGIYYKSGRKTVRLGYLSSYRRPALSGLPIAIITGRYTASAAEMILISFLGLPNVRIFGEPTFGVPTGKSNIFLSDSAFISLTTSKTYDRLGIVHDGPLKPDQEIDFTATTESQLTKTISKWIKKDEYDAD